MRTEFGEKSSNECMSMRPDQSYECNYRAGIHRGAVAAHQATGLRLSPTACFTVNSRIESRLWRSLIRAAVPDIGESVSVNEAEMSVTFATLLERSRYSR